jgi:hypothetical protein
MQGSSSSSAQQGVVLQAYAARRDQSTRFVECSARERHDGASPGAASTATIDLQPLMRWCPRMGAVPDVLSLSSSRDRRGVNVATTRSGTAHLARASALFGRSGHTAHATCERAVVCSCEHAACPRAPSRARRGRTSLLVARASRLASTARPRYSTRPR